MDEILTRISDIVWGPVMVALLVGTGLYITIRLGFVQFRYLSHAIACITGKYDHLRDEGEISHFRALTTALAATIGTGNIAGVATAIVMGGPGAIFWMWMTALVGMATKFCSCSLAIEFRNIHPDGSASGGPMYYIQKGFMPRIFVAILGQEGTRSIATLIAIMFALFTMIASFGIGNMVQANSVVDGLKYIMPESLQQGGVDIDIAFMGFSFHLNYFSLVIGLVLFMLAGLVIIGGIKRIASVTSRLVPLMSIFYVAGAITVLVLNYDKIHLCLKLIIKSAFTPYAAPGGIIGAMVAMRFGVARGVFSNESGLGSAPMAHAAARTKEMAREGFVAMLGPFIDTIVICTMTALVILVTEAALSDSSLNGSSLTAHAFDIGLFGYGQYIVGIGLILFAFSTLISWSYYGDRCAEFLFGEKAVIWYRYLYLVLVIVGAVGGLRLIWNLADIFNALMALPNLIGLIALVGIVAAKKKDYVKRLKAGEFAEPVDSSQNTRAY
jgi:AGCS family alanine or glycine:cation symporter